MTLEHRHAILDALMTAVDEETAVEIVEYRKRMGKRFALTLRSARMLAKNLAQCPDPVAAADEMMLRGWTAVKADWIAKSQSAAAYRQSARSANAEMNSMLFAEEPAYGHQIEHHADDLLLDFTGRHH